jgi:hypothetical protein
MSKLRVCLDARLRRLVADFSLDKEMLQEVILKRL